MTHALITITHRTVEHNDPEAAGFVDGYWWTLTSHEPRLPSAKPYVESARATAEMAEGQAREVAALYGYEPDEIEVVAEGELHDRRGDERRVDRLIATAVSARAAR